MNESVLIVGLGKIGMGYDIHNSNQDHVLTHARAFSTHRNFELCAGVDDLNEKRDLFEKIYRKPSYGFLKKALMELDPSIVVISTPTETHGEVLNQVLDLANPKIILCEKPLEYNLDVAREMVKRCEDAGTQLFVNYMRKSDPGVIEIKKRLHKEWLVKPIKACVWYSKGLFNNGSHLTNLLEDWMGDFLEAKIISVGRKIGNYDYEPDFYINYSGGRAIFSACNEEDFSHYTIELISSSGRLYYSHGGKLITWQSIKDDKIVQGYNVLTRRPEIIKNTLHKSQLNVVKEIFNFLKKTSFDLCDGKEALLTLENIIKVKNLVENG